MIRKSLLAALLLLAACSKDDARPAPTRATRPDPMVDSERQRGKDACQAYVDRLCKCAETKPNLKDTCTLKHAKIDALADLLQIDDDPTQSAQNVATAQDGARKIIEKCIEENEALDPQCPCRRSASARSRSSASGAVTVRRSPSGCGNVICHACSASRCRS